VVCYHEYDASENMHILARAILFLAVMYVPCSPAAEPRGFRLIIPNLGLSKQTDWIEEIHLTVACGHIEAITSIPMDWNIEVVRMLAGLEELHATAGHGASRLSAIGTLNGAVRLTNVDPQCFDVSAKIHISGDRSREIILPRAKLRLVP
jgi:hypothetical protein